MVSASQERPVLPVCAISAPVVHPDAERLTGAFLCETGAYGEMATSRLRIAEGGTMGVCLSALYTNKKRRRIFPYGVVRRWCVFLYVCCPPCPPCPPRPPRPPCPCRPPRIIYGMADNRRTTDRGLCEFVVRPEKPDISRVCGLGGLGGQGGQRGQQGGQNHIVVR